MTKTLLIILLLCPSNATAEVFDLGMRNKEIMEQKWTHGKSKESNKILPFVLLPLALPIHTLIHESSHAGVAKILGYKVIEFRPYPHFYNDNFYFGRINTDERNPSDLGQVLFSLAPHMTDILIFSTSDILLSTKIINIRSITGTVLYIFGIIAPLVDFSVGYLGGSDWDKARAVSDKTSITLNIIGAAVMFAGIYRALTHTVRLFE